jgi:hypothetical protein
MHDLERLGKVEMTQMRELIKRHDFMNEAAESNTPL